MQVAMTKTLSPGSILYDVGAHVGFMSLVGARLVGETGEVYAFEPDPENAAALRRHTQVNGLADRITVIEAAAWSSVGSVPFRRKHDVATFHYDGQVVRDQDAASVDVAATTIDTVSSQNPLPGLIKIDVEGEELEVLKGARRTLAIARPAILLEAHGQECWLECARFLEDAGYRCEILASEPDGRVRVLAVHPHRGYSILKLSH